MEGEDGSQSALEQNDDDPYEKVQLGGSQPGLECPEEELHNVSTWECHDDEVHGRDGRLAGALRIQARQGGNCWEVPHGGGRGGYTQGAWPGC